MRVALPYDNGNIFAHFGKAESFVLYDINGASYTSSIISTEGHSHHELAPFLKNKGVDAVICGGMGQGMVNALSACGIRIYGGNNGSCEEAVKAFIQNGLEERAESCHCHDH